MWPLWLINYCHLLCCRNASSMNCSNPQRSTKSPDFSHSTWWQESNGPHNCNRTQRLPVPASRHGIFMQFDAKRHTHMDGFHFKYLLYSCCLNAVMRSVYNIELKETNISYPEKCSSLYLLFSNSKPTWYFMCNTIVVNKQRHTNSHMHTQPLSLQSEMPSVADIQKKPFFDV